MIELCFIFGANYRLATGIIVLSIAEDKERAEKPQVGAAG